MRRTRALLAVVASVVALIAVAPAAANASGSGWHRVSAPIPTARTRPGRYAAVSCPTTSFCMAITTGFGPRGYRVGIAEVERHGRWTVSETPRLGPTRSSLNDVSCTSATSCVVVGSKNVVTSPLILRWNGTHWRMLTGSATAGHGPITAVSCASAGYCLAVGKKHDWVIRGDQLTQVAPSDVYTAVSCVSATFCLTVGSMLDHGVTSGLVQRWDGSTWSDVPAADVHGSDSRGATLTGVSCTVVAECSVVGNATHYVATSGNEHRFVTETEDSGSWHRRIFPKAAGHGSRTTYGISCTSRHQCVAAVRARVDGRLAVQLLTRRTGGWTLEPLRSPRGTPVTARLIAISCTSDGCTVVGGRHRARGFGQIVHERDATARDQAPATVREADKSTLLSVSCTGSSCLAVGYVDPPDSKLFPLAAATTGGGWHRVAVPQRAGELYGVSCVTAQFCMALGRGARRTVGTAAIWNGSGWRAVHVAGGPVRGLTCPTTQFCAGSPIHRGDELRWQVWRPGAGWRTETLVPPTGLHQFGPISCASATDCWTTRNYYGVDEQNHVLASHWDGSAWTTQQLPTDFIGALSCPSDNFCIAAGSNAAQVWDGTSWTAVPYANGAGLNSPRLSCVDADDCTVLGGTPLETAANTITQHWDGQEWGQQQSYPGSVFDVYSIGCGASGCVTVGSGNLRFVPTVRQNY